MALTQPLMDKAQKYVDDRVQPGSFGRLTDTYKPQVDNLLATQQASTAGYNAPQMAAAAQANQQALGGGAAAFGSKLGSGGAQLMAPAASNAAMMYNTGITADNAGAKARATTAYSNNLQHSGAQELAMAQANQQAQQGEQGLRASLPFDILNGINTTRMTGIADQSANDAIAAAAKYKGALADLEKAWPNIESRASGDYSQMTPEEKEQLRKESEARARSGAYETGNGAEERKRARDAQAGFSV